MSYANGATYGDKDSPLVEGATELVQVIVLSGPIAVGKTTFSNVLMERYQIEKVSTRKFIMAAKGVSDIRSDLQAAGAELDVETGGKWLADAVEASLLVTKAEYLLIDSARTVQQVTALRERFGTDVVHHFHLTAPVEILAMRYQLRSRETREFETYAQAAADPTEASVGALETIADVVVETDKSDAVSCVTYATAGRMSAVPTLPGYVDVFVGGQWGSEGKGNICSLIAGSYDVLVRVGGPNAGHKVAEPRYTYQQLPSGTGSNKSARVFIAAGSTIALETLRKELDAHPWLKARGLLIDPQAMIIERADILNEKRHLKKISSTMQGVGSASARKIMGRGVPLSWGPRVRLARDIAELKPYVGCVRLEIERALASGQRVMLEGTQGTELSIHHGTYPSVTSRETSVAGCLSDAGIPINKVRKVVLVVRTYPIRVWGASGPMGHEVTLDLISERSGIPVAQMYATEQGSVSRKTRRIAELDWEKVRASTYLNGATDIALTFVDYLGVENRDAHSLNELSDKARRFIADLERVCGVPVSLISKSFGKDGLIDRRGWK